MATRIPLPDGWGEAWLHELGQHRQNLTGTVRAYDHRGRQLVWQPPAIAERAACDVEDSSVFSPERASIFGLNHADACRRWVTTEVLAKLSDVPILTWIKTRGIAQNMQQPNASSTSLVVLPLGDNIMLGFGLIRGTSVRPIAEKSRDRIRAYAEEIMRSKANPASA